jgi:flagellar motility protein MotE (MotC chaperone)
MNRNKIRVGIWLWGVLAMLALQVGGLGVASGAGNNPIIQDPIKLLESLEQQRQQLEEQRKAQELREAELTRMSDQIQKRIGTLEGLRLAIEQDLDKERELDQGNIQRLSKIYSSMKPKEAANQLRSLDRETGIKVLKAMSERKAAKILMFMGKEAAKDAVELGNELGIPISERRERDNATP